MPVTKPTTTPRWADVGGAIVEPSSGKKDVGWVTAERPPAQYFNWLLNLIYLWVEFAKFRLGRVHTKEYTADADLTQTEVATGLVTHGYNQGPEGGSGGTLGWSFFTTAATDEAEVGAGYVFLPPSNTHMIHFLEYEIDCTALAGTPAITMRHGFSHDVDNVTEDQACFEKTSGSANWFAFCRGTATETKTDLGVAATGVQRFTTIWYGATVSPSAAQRVEFYIDGVLKLATGTNLPNQDPMAFGCIQFSTGHTDDRTCRLSPVKYQCCRYSEP